MVVVRRASRIGLVGRRLDVCICAQREEGSIHQPKSPHQNRFLRRCVQGWRLVDSLIRPNDRIPTPIEPPALQIRVQVRLHRIEPFSILSPFHIPHPDPAFCGGKLTWYMLCVRSGTVLISGSSFPCACAPLEPRRSSGARTEHQLDRNFMLWLYVWGTVRMWYGLDRRGVGFDLRCT